MVPRRRCGLWGDRRAACDGTNLTVFVHATPVRSCRHGRHDEAACPVGGRSDASAGSMSAYTHAIPPWIPVSPSSLSYMRYYIRISRDDRYVRYLPLSPKTLTCRFLQTFLRRKLTSEREILTWTRLMTTVQLFRFRSACSERLQAICAPGQ